MANSRDFTAPVGVLLGMMLLLPGCYSIQNGWLDPTVLGRFQEGAVTEIRTSLTLDDQPYGITGAAYPTSEDLEFKANNYPIQGGDVLNITVDELRERFVPFQDPQATVSPTGFVNLPVVGRVEAAGLTVPEFEDKLTETLIEREILMKPEVTVNPQFLQKATYSIFGIGVSASNNAPLRAGTFPIRRPDLRVLEAINQVGGLNEFVTDIFIFRNDDVAPPKPTTTEPAPDDTPADGTANDGSSTAPSADETETETSPVEELLDAVDQDEPPPADDAEDAPAPEPPAALLEGDPTDAWLYVDGEFVPNHEYVAPTEEEDASRQALVLDSTASTVNWARVAGDTNFHIIRIPAEELRTGAPTANIYVRAGDVIRVVSGEIGVYYVMGQVNRTGPFAFNSEPITLKAAIATAGGLAPLAWPDRCTVYRKLGQREQMIQVNLDRMFAGKEPDFFIHRGDIINVGTHPFAPFLQRIRAMTLPNIVNSLGFGFSYTRNFADIDSFGARANPNNQPDLLPQLFQ